MNPRVITIIGGGWSVAHVPLERLSGFIIAVNDSAIYAPRWDVALSMDRLWAENRIDVLARRVAETNTERCAWLRENALQNLQNWPRMWPFVRPFECDHESTVFTIEPSRLNGTSSGMCALNLAWKMQPTRLYLLGFDMNRSKSGQPYWYPPYKWATPAGSTTDGKYARWSKQFDDAAASFKLINCEVANVNPLSAIDSFRKITPMQFLKETT